MKKGFGNTGMLPGRARARYPLPMRSVLRLAPAALLFLACPAWAAAIIDKVQVAGLDPKDPTQALMIENIELALSLSDSLGKRVGESRLEYLLDEAAAEASEALQPFGYYSAQIRVEAPRPERDDDDDIRAPGDGADADASRRPADHISVTVHVQLGEPVRVRNAQLAIDGEGSSDKYLQADLDEFQPRTGEVFDHTVYEASKTRIVRRLAERGYLDADFTRRRVEVTRADHAADIELGWVSGIRYDMGPTRFHQDYFKPGLLERLVYWDEGSYFHQGKLDRLRQSLVGLDYFSRIDIVPNLDDAQDGQVPIDVGLALAKRNVYTFGISYGTESGPGVRAGVERRYVNSRGHKLGIDLDYAKKRKILTTLYRIPAFKWLDGWYGVAFRAYDEQTDYIDTRLIELIGSRSGQINEQWVAQASLHALRERWRYDQTQPDFFYSSLFYPELTGQYSGVDDRSFPRRGFSGNVALRVGAGQAGSDASFTQLQVIARWYHGIGDNQRLLVRGEAGTTWTSDLVALPPSLRYFAGGDRSVRGYAYREIGPRLENRFALGAKHVLTGSVEYEYYLPDSAWGGAVFVDSGSAFDGRPDFRTGIGIGLRWRSPVGPVRLDIAHGLDDADSPVQLYLNIGADL